MKFNRIPTAAAAAAALLVATLTAAHAAETVTLKLGHGQSATSPRHLAGTKFAELVAKKTQGRVAIQLIAAGEAGDDAAMIKAMRAGTLDMSINSQGVMSKEVPEFAALGLPFLFSSLPKAWALLDGPLGKELVDKSAAKGLVVLGLWDNGIRNITNNVRPVLKPEDMKGLKMRTPPDAVTVDIMTALGASAQQIKWTEVPGALAANVVDGQENPLSNIESAKLYTVQKYISLTGHKYEVAPLIVSAASLDKLSDADRKAVADAARETTPLSRKLTKESDDTLIEVLKGHGMKVDKVDPAAFAKATEGVTQRWLTSDIGPFVKKVVAAAKS